MVELDPIRRRRWDGFSYRDPKVDLINLGKLQARIAKATGISPTVADLRTRDLRQYLEWRQAALFCYLIATASGIPSLAYTVHEDEDFDSLACWIADDTKHYALIQLKEVVPEDRNPLSSVEAELAKLAKYVTSEETVIAVHVNRTGRIDFTSLALPKINCREVWLYGALSPDQQLWFLYGNLLHEPRFHEIAYPT